MNTSMQQPFYPPLPGGESIREIVFASVSRGASAYYDALPQTVVDAFLVFAQQSYPESFENIRQKHPEDLRVYAAQWQFKVYTEEELRKHGLVQASVGLIGLDHLVIVDTTEGHDSGVQLAQKYGFVDGEKRLQTTRTAEIGYLAILDTKRLGEGLLFLGGSQEGMKNVYTVGYVWAPEEWMDRYRVSDFKSIPGY